MTARASLGFQAVSNLSTAVGITVPSGAGSALIVAEGQDVRWRDDGTAPTASVGMLLAAGASMLYEGDLARLQFIQTAASATLDVTCYR